MKWIFPTLAGALTLALTATTTQADVYNPASGQRFSSIQAAIDAATAGDTLQISAGTYTESVNVNKTLNLEGAGTEATIIDANQLGNPISVSANNVAISGLRVTNCLPDSAAAGLKVHSGFTGFQGQNILATGNTGAGLHITGGNATLTNCTATDNVWGIRLDYSDNHTLSGCVASNNQRQDASTGNYGQGIRIISVNNSSLNSCQTNQNAESGILVSKDSGTTSDISMTGCTSNNNGTIVPANGYGVFVTNSASITFSGGSITGNQAWGFRDTNSTGTSLASSAIASNGSGNVYLQLSINTRIEGNNIGTSSTDSVELLDTQGVEISDNTISGAINGTDNIHAIKLRGNTLGAANTTITDNTLSGNRNGIRIEGASAFNRWVFALALVLVFDALVCLLLLVRRKCPSSPIKRSPAVVGSGTTSG
jgi:parallel beta-helix repeat protein